MSLESSSSGNSILSKTSQLLSSLIKPTTTASNNTNSSDSTDDELTSPIEKTQNSYTYYQQKQEQLKKQQAQANKRRKFFSSSNPASSSSSASLSTVGAFPSPALNSPTSSIVNATGNHHHEPYLNSPLQQHHSSHHKPGTITKVRGAQYSLPMNHIAQQPSPMSHFSTTATVTATATTATSHHNNDSLSTLSNDDESSATPTTHTTSDQQQQQKSKRVSIETNKNRVLQVDEMKLQQQIQNVHHTSNTINTNTINSTTNSTSTTSTSHSANTSSLSTVSSSSILDDLSNMNQKLKKTTNALAELDLIGNIKRIASSGSNNNNNNNNSNNNNNNSNNNSHMTPDSFNYVVDGSSSSSNDSFSPEAIVEMMNTGSKSSRNMNSSDLDDSSNRDEYDQVLNQNKLHKFHVLLNQHDVDLDQLRKLSWNGVPASVRALTWKLLLGYANCNAARRESLLQKKRSEYKQMVERFFNEGTMKKTEYENSLQRQIHIDVPRTNPDVTLFQQEKIQEALERILYVWSVRHPASGYVQGINDMVTPFMIVFLRDELYRRGGSDEVVSNVLDMDASTIDDESFDNMEADSFWCFTQFLDFIQDHYTFAQPGIQRMVHKLEEITRKIDEPLYNHIQNQGLSFIQFAFRWMNCLLMRELSLKLIIRIFDAYLAEGDNFEILHVYVCATFLKSWSERLRKLDFTEMVIFIQHLPTQSWTFKEIATILSQAYMLKVRYDETNHLF